MVILYDENRFPAINMEMFWDIPGPGEGTRGTQLINAGERSFIIKKACPA
jgi:hypothetical protein